MGLVPSEGRSKFPGLRNHREKATEDAGKKKIKKKKDCPYRYRNRKKRAGKAPAGHRSIKQVRKKLPGKTGHLGQGKGVTRTKRNQKPCSTAVKKLKRWIKSGKEMERNIGTAKS